MHELLIEAIESINYRIERLESVTFNVGATLSEKGRAFPQILSDLKEKMDHMSSLIEKLPPPSSTQNNDQ